MALTSRERVGSRSDRRAELLAAALGLVRSSGLEHLDAGGVAAAAGVSKALVYYYFPSHRDLQVAVVESAAADLLAGIEAVADPGLSPAEQLHAGLDAAIASIEQQPEAFAALARGTGSHPQLLAVFERTRDAVAEVLADRLGIGDLTPRQRIAVRSWIALAEEAVLHWIVADRPVPRAELVAYCEDVALHILSTHLVVGSPRPR